MNPISGVVRMHARNKLIWFVVPWIVLLGNFAISLAISYLLGGKPIITGGLSSIYIFMFVLGTITLPDTFVFAISLSVRRIDYMLGTALMVLATSVITGLLLFSFSLLENNLTHGWGMSLHFFFLPYINDGPLIIQFWVYCVPLVMLYALGFLVGSIYRRFGKTGMWTFSIAMFLTASGLGFVWTYYHWWETFFGTLAQYSAFTYIMWMVPAIAGCALVSYALLRKAAI